MPDATYVGAGMPCGNCGNPLTPGQPHKCGRTPDFDRRLDESWEPSPAASPDERLREALAFYADKGNYTAQNPVGSGAHVWRDMGGRARAALAAADRDKEEDER